MPDSVLAHLARTLSGSPENVATEALGYILRTSPTAEPALRGFLHQAGIEIKEPLIFSNQAVGETAERPDLVGIDGKGGEWLIVEAKFWAGFTANQPVAYMKRPTTAPSKTVLFVCPSQRVGLIWAELIRRCGEENLILSHTDRVVGDTRLANASPYGNLAVTSWRAVLHAIELGLDNAGDQNGLADVRQLGSLCDYMDTDAYLPVSSEELTHPAFRRVIQFGDLAPEIYNRFLNLPDVVHAAGKSASGFAWTGKFFDLPTLNLRCFLGADIKKWVLAFTPFWFLVYGPNLAKAPPNVRVALASYETATPRQLFQNPDGGLSVPLFVPPNVEKDQVVDSIVKQARKVTRILEEMLPTAVPTPSMSGVPLEDELHDRSV